MKQNLTKITGANVINLPLSSILYSQSFGEVFQDAYDNGVLIVSAAGNRGDLAFYAYPASYSTIMSIAATKRSSTAAFFSSINNQVELSAPGVDINSTIPNNAFSEISGTSMVTPHISGVAGLIWIYFPECSNQQIRNILSLSSMSLSEDGQCNEYTGYGLIQAIDAYNLLSQSDCGGFANIIDTKGGCEQLNTYSLSCSVDSDCDDLDPCTVDICNEVGRCESSIDCSQCQKDGLVTVDIVPGNFWPVSTVWYIYDWDYIYIRNRRSLS